MLAQLFRRRIRLLSIFHKYELPTPEWAFVKYLWRNQRMRYTVAHIKLINYKKRNHKILYFMRDDLHERKKNMFHRNISNWILLEPSPNECSVLQPNNNVYFVMLHKIIAQYFPKNLFEGLIEQPKRNFARGRNG